MWGEMGEGYIMGLPECRKIYDSIPYEKKIPATKFLKEHLLEKNKILRRAINKDPIHWFTLYHFHWGMWVRNLLRENNFSEEYFGISNLDDIYVELVEDAVK